MTTINSVNLGLSGATGTGNFVGSTSPTITTPKIAQINDANGNEILALVSEASAVNYIQIYNNATANSPDIISAGSDTNVGMTFSTKGTGVYEFITTATTDQFIFAYGAASALNSAFNFAGTGTGSIYTFPTAVGTVAISGAAQAVTFASTTFSSTSGIIGTTTNDNAAAGSVGQLISSVISSGSAVSYTSTGTKDLTSISLTAGDWDVYGNILFAGTLVQSYGVWISLTSATLPDLSLITFAGPGTTVGGINAPYFRASLAMTTTVYLTGTVTGTGTLTGQGGIYARRVR